MESQQILILQNGQVISSKLIESSSNDQWALHRGPKGEMTPGFCKCQVAVPDFKHIGIVVSPKCYTVETERILIQDFSDACPPWVNIARYAPGVSN